MTDVTDVPDRRTGDTKLDALSERMDDLAAQHVGLKKAVDDNTAITTRIDRNTADMVAAWGALEGGMKVLNILGKVAKWVGIIAGTFTAVMTAIYVIVHGGPGPTP